MKKKKVDIAIVGMACRFPDANDYEEFWENLDKGVNSIKEITPDRWNIETFYSPNIDDQGKSVSKWCGLMDNIYDFDNKFFNISPREARNMDPQQRVLMEETWHCIEDSGISLHKLQNKTTSVYVGVMTTDYRQELTRPDHQPDSYACMGNYESILANRLSYVFDFQGASMPINAACASSLVAIHEAKRALILGECDYAIASSVNLNIHPWKYISFSKSRMLSPDGQCKTFDIDANGYVPGDGVGVLLLQRLDDAIKNGNRIYGTIKGSAINHVGKSLSITAPRMESQRDVILAAYKDAGFHPETVSYVEAHGTGTSLGDPIEIESLTQAFRKYTDKKQFCKIGSVKTNIGHLEGAAGLAGVIKILMMMKYKKIPRTLNVRTINPIIDFSETPFSIATSCSKWKAEEDGVPLRASVSSFGFGGVNSHILLEEYKDIQLDEQLDPPKDEFFILSTKNIKSMENLIAEWEIALEKKSFDSYRLSDLSMTLLTGRDSFAYRYGVLVNSKEELLEILQTESFSFHNNPKKNWCIQIRDFRWNGYADLVPLTLECDIFKQKLDTVLKTLKGLRVNREILNKFFEDSWAESYPSLYLFIAGYAYAATLIELGFSPKWVLGEKSGIWVAMAITGMMSLKDILAVKSGKMEINEVCLRRPSIPLYDPVTRETYLPFHFDEGYLQGLLESLNENTLELAHDYVLKTRLLYESQFTFKKYIDDWDDIVKRSFSCSIKTWLNDDDLIISGKSEFKKEKSLLMIAIISSFTKLNQKWNLQERRLIDDQRFYEIVELLADEVMPKDMIVELVANDNPDLTKAAKTLDHNQKKMNMNQSYVYIRKSNENIHEIANTIDWIRKVESTEAMIPYLENTLYLQCGTISSVSSRDNVGIELTGDIVRNFKEMLLQIWLKGIDICWDKLYRPKSFKKANLPVYNFQRETFRLFNPKRQDECGATRKPSEQNSDDANLKQLLYRLEAGELEVHDIKKLMGDA